MSYERNSQIHHQETHYCGIFLEHLTTEDPHHQKQPIWEFWEKGKLVLVLEDLCDLQDFRCTYSLKAATEDGGSGLEGERSEGTGSRAQSQKHSEVGGALSDWTASQPASQQPDKQRCEKQPARKKAEIHSNRWKDSKHIRHIRNMKKQSKTDTDQNRLDRDTETRRQSGTQKQAEKDRNSQTQLGTHGSSQEHTETGRNNLEHIETGRSEQKQAGEAPERESLCSGAQSVEPVLVQCNMKPGHHADRLCVSPPLQPIQHQHAEPVSWCSGPL